jgi:hypothetical protein
MAREVRRGWNFVMIFTLLIVSGLDGQTQQMDYFWLCLGALEASQPKNKHHNSLSCGSLNECFVLAEGCEKCGSFQTCPYPVGNT